jgi:hypothetical protein
MMFIIESGVVGILCGFAPVPLVDYKFRRIDTDLLHRKILKNGILIAASIYIIGILALGLFVYFSAHDINRPISDLLFAILDMAYHGLFILVWMVSFVIGLAFGLVLWRLAFNK